MAAELQDAREADQDEGNLMPRSVVYTRTSSATCAVAWFQIQQTQTSFGVGRPQSVQVLLGRRTIHLVLLLDM